MANKMTTQSHFAFAQATLFGDDERTLQTSQALRSVLESMPTGEMSERQFRVVAQFITWAKFSAFARFMTTLLANHGKISDQELARVLAGITGDLPSGETVARTYRKLIKETRFKGKIFYVIEPMLKKRKKQKKPQPRKAQHQ